MRYDVTFSLDRTQYEVVPPDHIDSEALSQILLRDFHYIASSTLRGIVPLLPQAQAAWGLLQSYARRAHRERNNGLSLSAFLAVAIGLWQSQSDPEGR